MKFLKSIEIILVIIYTLLFIYDYFPNFPFEDTLSPPVLSGVVVCLILFSLLFKGYCNPTDQDKLKWEVFLFIYTLCLLSLLTILGGKSSIGISFDKGFFWILFTIALFEIFFRWKKVKRRSQ